MRILPILALITFSSVCSAQTIADIARQQRARQGNIQTKVIVTNDSVSVSRPVAGSGTFSTASVPDVIPLVIDEPFVAEVHPRVHLTLVEYAEVLAPPPAPVRDEKWWRKAFQDGRNNVKEAEDQVITLQVALNQARLDSLEKTDAQRERRLAAEIARLKRELDSAQKDLASARKTLSDLEEELRRSSGPSTWAR